MASADKRKRRRIDRARRRKTHRRHETQAQQADARYVRAERLAAAAEAAMAARDFAGAVEHATRAAAAAPHDTRIAALWVDATERFRVPSDHLAALEHLATLVPTQATLLVTLAQLHLQAGHVERAQELAREVRRTLPSRDPGRRYCLAQLAELERAMGRPAPDDDGQAQLPLVPSAAAPVPQAVDPPSPALEPFAITVAVEPEVVGFDVVGAPAASAPRDVELALAAAELVAAESFDRLLALERAHGLVRLSHQEETARKVLERPPRPRAARRRGRARQDDRGRPRPVRVPAARSRAAGARPGAGLARPPVARGARGEVRDRHPRHGRRRVPHRPAAAWEGAGVIVASLATARGRSGTARRSRPGRGTS